MQNPFDVRQESLSRRVSHRFHIALDVTQIDGIFHVIRIVLLVQRELELPRLRVREKRSLSCIFEVIETERGLTHACVDQNAIHGEFEQSTQVRGIEFSAKRNEKKQTNDNGVSTWPIELRTYFLSSLSAACKSMHSGHCHSSCSCSVDCFTFTQLK